MHRLRFFIHTLTHLVTDHYGGFLAPLLPLLAAKHDLSLAMAGLLVSAQTAAASLSQPLWAVLSDKKPSRWFIILGVLGAGVFLSLIGIMPTVSSLAVIVFAGGMGIACFHPLSTALASKLAARRKGAAIAFFITGGSAGYALGPILISVIVGYWGLRSTPVAVIPAILIAVSWYFLGPRNVTELINHTPPKTGNPGTAGIPIKPVVFLTTTSLVRAFVLLSFINFISFYLQDLGLELQSRSYYIFALQFGGALGGLFYGSLSDSIGRWRVMLWTPLLALPFLYLFFYTRGIVSFMLLFLAGTLLFASAPAVVVSAQKLMAGREGMASALQIGLAWGAGGLAMGLVGKAGEIFGIYQVLYVTAGLPLVMVLLAFALRKYRYQFEADVLMPVPTHG
jgi:FSR family fosmidomycin resistance protein-like MFS transporter